MITIRNLDKIIEKNFFSAARYMNINRPINGYYFEFGCNEANTQDGL